LDLLQVGFNCTALFLPLRQHRLNVAHLFRVAELFTEGNRFDFCQWIEDALTDAFHQGLYGLALVDTRGVVPFLVFSLANIQGTLDR
jgi:hypothetical protein